MKPITIKAGYLVVAEGSDAWGRKRGEDTFNMTAIPDKDGEIGLVCKDEETYHPLERYNDDLRYGHTTILKVYGGAPNKFALRNTTEGRELLWERPAPEPVIPTKEMTVAEIEAQLGHKVKVVGE